MFSDNKLALTSALSTNKRFERLQMFIVSINIFGMKQCGTLRFISLRWHIKKKKICTQKNDKQFPPMASTIHVITLLGACNSKCHSISLFFGDTMLGTRQRLIYNAGER